MGLSNDCVTVINCMNKKCAILVKVANSNLRSFKISCKDCISINSKSYQFTFTGLW